MCRIVGFVCTFLHGPPILPPSLVWRPKTTMTHPTQYQRGETIIRRNARGSYSILFADGSLSVSFVPTMKQAELEAARLDAMIRRDALRGLRNADLAAVVVVGGAS